MFEDGIVEEFHESVSSKSLARINHTVSMNSVSIVVLNKWVYVVDMDWKCWRFSCAGNVKIVY